MTQSGVQSPNDLTIMAGVALEATRKNMNLSYNTLISGSSVMETLSLGIYEFLIQSDGSISSDQVASNSEGRFFFLKSKKLPGVGKNFVIGIIYYSM